MASSAPRASCRRLSLTLATCLVALTASTSARAATPTDLDKDAARTLIQQGDEKLKRGDTAGALEAYRRADSIMNVPTTAIEVARLELGQGKLLEALEACQRAAKHPSAPNEPAPFARARSEATAVLEVLKERIPRLTLEVHGLPFELEPEIVLDGQPSDRTRDIAVNPGDHVVVANATGYLEARRQITVAEGDHATVVLELTPVSREAPPPTLAPATMWPLAYAGFALAGAGAIAGGVTGGISLMDAAELEAGCDETACPEELEPTLSRSLTMAHVSTGSFIAAGVGAALGITGVALSMSAESEEPRASFMVLPVLDAQSGGAFGLVLAWTSE